jgi:hypothetical protein
MPEITVTLYLNGFHTAPATLWQALLDSPQIARLVRLPQLLHDGEVYVTPDEAEAFLALARTLPGAIDQVAGTEAFLVLPRPPTIEQGKAYLASRRALRPRAAAPAVAHPQNVPSRDPSGLAGPQSRRTIPNAYPGDRFPPQASSQAKDYRLQRFADSCTTFTAGGSTTSYPPCCNFAMVARHGMRGDYRCRSDNGSTLFLLCSASPNGNGHGHLVRNGPAFVVSPPVLVLACDGASLQSDCPILSRGSRPLASGGSGCARLACLGAVPFTPPPGDSGLTTA